MLFTALRPPHPRQAARNPSSNCMLIGNVNCASCIRKLLDAKVMTLDSKVDESIVPKKLKLENWAQYAGDDTGGTLCDYANQDVKVILDEQLKLPSRSAVHVPNTYLARAAIIQLKAAGFQYPKHYTLAHHFSKIRLSNSPRANMSEPVLPRTAKQRKSETKCSSSGRN